MILAAHDIGYKIFVNENLAAESKSGDELELFTHQYIREDALDLYGFTAYEKLAMFEMLLSVSGIGPKKLALIKPHLILDGQGGEPQMDAD